VVETRLALEPEVREIFDHIDNGKNFLLSGGAGSGKTYSLVQVIKQAIAENPSSQIACMTYTNAAVKEIESRVNSKFLSVSTIHEFLWNNIKPYQRELRSSLIELMNDANTKEIKSLDEITDTDYFINKKIQYKEYTLIREGIISHDELILLAKHMYAKYPKLSDILKSKFKFILIDEYQDTSPHVIEIVLVHLKQSSKQSIVGFFGDAMQSIYDDGIGDLDQYISSEDIKEVKKEQNRRNPRLIYELANRLRTDGIVQVASNDNLAPNMENGVVKEGFIRFYHSRYQERLEDLKIQLDWDFSDSENTKELNLTHNLIAQKAGFSKLMDIYDRDPVIALKNSIIEKIKNNPGNINVEEKDTFDDVVSKAQLKDRKKQLKKDILLTKHPDLYELLKDLPFSDVRKIYISKDALIDDKKEDEVEESKIGSKRDALIKHLFKIQENIDLYKEGRFNSFLRKTEFRIKTSGDKVRLKVIISELQEMSDKTIEQVIEYANDVGICKKDDKLSDFIENNTYIYNRVKKVEFREFQNLFSYLDGRTPFSTQHKIKGKEFDNVLVVLDNGGWTKYNFQYLFEGRGNQSVLGRTKKIFYVCCTRAKEKLVVYYHDPSEAALSVARDWFGHRNVVCID
jgi:DNA helicase-2/ATP-dependent DNA helicase PcrA